MKQPKAETVQPCVICGRKARLMWKATLVGQDPAKAIWYCDECKKQDRNNPRL